MKIKQQGKIAKIAESCGWSDIKYHEDGCIRGLMGNHLAKDGVYSRDWIPDYFNDLNAMHEAEKFLSGDDLERYKSVELGYQIQKHHKSGDEYFGIFHAPAYQRAEAFILALELWKESE